ncbi:hypothetical protein BaRGS_00015654, partial [Batillaria attramentaria]
FSLMFRYACNGQLISKDVAVIGDVAVAVVIAFFVCWAPFHTQRLMTIYIPQEAWTPELLTIQTYIFYIS